MKSISIKFFVIFSVFLTSNLTFAEECPQNFSDILMSKNETDIYQKHIGTICKGRIAQISAPIDNIEEDEKGNIYISLRPIDGGYHRVLLAKKSECDVLKMRKKDILKISAKLIENPNVGYWEEGICIKT